MSRARRHIQNRQRYLRSGLGNHVAGYGMELAFIENEESWRDRKVSVRLPHDNWDDEMIASLSGNVITRRL